MEEFNLDDFSEFEGSQESAISVGTTSSYYAASDLHSQADIAATIDGAGDFPDLDTLANSIFPEPYPTQTNLPFDVNNNYANYVPMESMPNSRSNVNTMPSNGSYRQKQPQQQQQSMYNYNSNYYGNNNHYGANNNYNVNYSYAQAVATPTAPYLMGGYTMVTPMSHFDGQQQQAPQQQQYRNHSMAMYPNMYPPLPTNNTKARVHPKPAKNGPVSYASVASTGGTVYPFPSATTTTTSVTSIMPGASMAPPSTSAGSLEGDEAKKLLLTAEEKRKQKLERNRLAARKCRQKKMDNIAKCEKDLGKLQAETSILEEEVKAMREKKTRLRQMILQWVMNPELIPSFGGQFPGNGNAGGFGGDDDGSGMAPFAFGNYPAMVN